MPINDVVPASPSAGKEAAIGFDGLALCLVVLSGSLCLAMPFWADQALFTLYARELTEGAVLYRDVFDVKQPGIFIFYLIAGLLFGFTEVGIHLFELVWWLAFSVFALVALRPYFTTRWAASLVPVFTVVVYYCFAWVPDLGQVEILVAFPLLVAWWLIDQADPSTRRGLTQYAAAGAFAAAVVLLKHLYLLIVLAFLVNAGLRSVRQGVPHKDVLRAYGSFLLLLAAPLLVVTAYFAIHGQLGRIWWAYFEMAPAAQLFTPRPLKYLIAGARKFLIGHAPVLILAVIGCVHMAGERTRPAFDLVTGMVLWVAAGVIAFLVLQGWPEYKWPLFTVPVGILAVVGAEVLVARARSLGRTVVTLGVAALGALSILSFVIATVPEHQTHLLWAVVIGACAAVAAELLAARRRVQQGIFVVLSASFGITLGLAAIVPANKIRVLIEHDFALADDSRTEFQRLLNGAYSAADEDLAVLQHGDVLPGPLYVFGDPVLLLRSNRAQAVPILGWGPDFLDERAWRELNTGLRATLPPYIVVARYMVTAIRNRCPAILEFIDSGYDVAFEGRSGTWYVRRKPTRGADQAPSLTLSGASPSNPELAFAIVR